MSEQDKEEDMAPRSEDDGEKEGDDETDKDEQPETDQRPCTAKSVIFRKTVAIFTLSMLYETVFCRCLFSFFSSFGLRWGI